MRWEIRFISSDKDFETFVSLTPNLSKAMDLSQTWVMDEHKHSAEIVYRFGKRKGQIKMRYWYDESLQYLTY